MQPKFRQTGLVQWLCIVGEQGVPKLEFSEIRLLLHSGHPHVPIKAKSKKYPACKWSTNPESRIITLLPSVEGEKTRVGVGNFPWSLILTMNYWREIFILPHCHCLTSIIYSLNWVVFLFENKSFTSLVQFYKQEITTLSTKQAFPHPEKQRKHWTLAMEKASFKFGFLVVLLLISSC